MTYKSTLKDNHILSGVWILILFSCTYACVCVCVYISAYVSIFTPQISCHMKEKKCPLLLFIIYCKYFSMSINILPQHDF